MCLCRINSGSERLVGEIWRLVSSQGHVQRANDSRRQHSSLVNRSRPLVCERQVVRRAVRLPALATSQTSAVSRSPHAVRENRRDAHLSVSDRWRWLLSSDRRHPPPMQRPRPSSCAFASVLPTESKELEMNQANISLLSDVNNSLAMMATKLHIGIAMLCIKTKIRCMGTGEESETHQISNDISRPASSAVEVAPRRRCG